MRVPSGSAGSSKVIVVTALLDPGSVRTTAEAAGVAANTASEAATIVL